MDTLRYIEAISSWQLAVGLGVLAADVLQKTQATDGADKTDLHESKKAQQDHLHL
jgi:signal transduction histidine kinase